MATAFTHSFLGACLGQAALPQKNKLKFWILTLLYPSLPDADVIGFKFGVHYGDLWGHRGMTHSLFFAAVLALVTVGLAYRENKFFSLKSLGWSLYFFALTASHGVLDAMTDGGLGIAFFSPFDPTRYFFDWRPIHVSPISVQRFFFGNAFAILKSEIYFIWLPAVVLAIFLFLARRIIFRSKQPFPAKGV